MEVRAVAKYLRVQPRKVRIVADEIRGKDAIHSAHLLRFHPSKSAFLLRKVLNSAIANAVENNQLDPSSLKISTIMVDEGPRLKRMRARAQGRGYRILKKTSHITVVLEDVEPTAAVRPHGTKAKPRPTLAIKGKKGKAAKPVAAEEVATEPIEETPVVAEPTETPAAAETTPDEQEDK